MTLRPIAAVQPPKTLVDYELGVLHSECSWHWGHHGTRITSQLRENSGLKGPQLSYASRTGTKIDPIMLRCLNVGYPWLRHDTLGSIW